MAVAMTNMYWNHKVFSGGYWKYPVGTIFIPKKGAFLSVKTFTNTIS